MGKLRFFHIARFLRNIFFLSFIIATVALTFYPRASTILPYKELTEAGFFIEVNNPLVEIFFRHQLNGYFETEDFSTFKISLQSGLGHYRVRSDKNFSLPVWRVDRVYVSAQRAGTNAPLKIKDVSLHRELMGGGVFFLLILFLAACYFHPLADKNITREKSYRMFILLISACASLLLMCVILEIIYPFINPQKPWHLFRPNLARKIYNYPDVMPGIPGGEVLFKINSEGIRARERDVSRWEDVTSILCIGGSTTECIYLDEGNDWPAVLESRLRREIGQDFWVGNAGKAGLSTSHLTTVANNYIPRIKPRYVVLLTGFNEDIASCVPDDEKLGERLTAKYKEEPLWHKIIKNMDKWVIFGLIRSGLFNRRIPSLHDVIVTEDNSFIIERREKAKRETMLNPPLNRGWKDLDLSRFEKEIKDIYNIAKKAGAKLVLCTQPTMYREDLTQKEKECLWLVWAWGNFTARSMRERMDIINDKIRQLGEKLSIPVVDLDKRLPRTTEVFYDDCHFNIHGARLVADELHSFFIEELNVKVVRSNKDF